ncbi:MAG: hypothetical protein LT070_10675 [Solirubrobacteraceae bacterium]|nr:hypothetical protein [Solirubrobacteraceae bacterium]
MTEDLKARHRELTERLADYYRGAGYPVRFEDGLIFASGAGGVTWIGAAVTQAELDSGELEARLPEIAERRMPEGGQLCPFELLPDPPCADELRALLSRYRLDVRATVTVYKLPEAIAAEAAAA